jgi:hypothetical protein
LIFLKNKPIIFQTNGANERMRLTPTGELGLGTTTPASFLHLNTTATGNLFRTDGATSDLNQWQMFTGGTQRFKIYTQTNNNVFLESTTTNAIFGLRTGNGSSNGLRMLVKGESNSNGGSGRIAMGNNLQENFTPRDRLHLHHNDSASPSPVRIRFSNETTGSGINDGVYMGIETNGLFRLRQHENQNMVFQTPVVPTLNPPVGGFPASVVALTRLQILPNGQVCIGEPTYNNNVIDGGSITGFGSFTSLLNVKGPINSCYPISNANPEATVLYGYTSPDLDPFSSAPIGFRMKMHRNFFGNQIDAFIIEKSDGANLNPRGGIVFTNVGSDTVVRTSMIIHGTGQTYVGSDNAHAPINRFTIDSDSIDATPAGLRFIKLPATSPTVANVGNKGVLAVDSTGNVIYVDGGVGQGFVACADTTNAADLQSNVKINMNKHNIYYQDNDSLGMNHVGIGYQCDDVLPGKLSVMQIHPDPVNTNTTAGYFHNSDESPDLSNISFFGVQGHVDGYNYREPGYNIGGYFTSKNGLRSFGVVGEAFESDSINNTIAYGGAFSGLGKGPESAGVVGVGRYATARNYGGKFMSVSATDNIAYGVHSESTGTGEYNYGVYTVAEDADNNIGIYAEAGPSSGVNPPTGPNYAAFLVGDVYIDGFVLVTSDENLKEDISSLDSANLILNQLNPVTFNYKQDGIYERMHLPNSMHYGLIAQEVETILPTLVKDARFPAEYDSLGNVTAAAIDFKTMNYEALIPILVKGHQEQSAQITEKDSMISVLDSIVTIQQTTISDLNDRLTQLENCLSGILPFLCQLSQQSIQENTPAIARVNSFAIGSAFEQQRGNHFRSKRSKSICRANGNQFLHSRNGSKSTNSFLHSRRKINAKRRCKRPWFRKHYCFWE